MAKSIGVAYTPVGEQTNIPVQAPQKIETPNYPDSGVAFGGYAKIYVGNGNFRLLKQYSYKRSTELSWTASDAELTLSTLQQLGKNIFITGISVSCYSNTNCHFNIYEYGSNIEIASISVGTNMSNAYGVSVVPIKIDAASYGFKPNVAITGKLTVNFFGFYEDS